MRMNASFPAFVNRIAVLAMLSAGVAGRHAQAAQLAGVNFPATETAGNVTLVLNGIGLRTYSMFAINVYVAALYLQQPSHDSNTILASATDKILLLYFVHDVSVGQVRNAWRKGLLRNCPEPCEIKQSQLSVFLKSLTAMHAGETVRFVFSPDGVRVYYDQALAGNIPDPEFARRMLAVFIGRYTTVPTLRRALLGPQPGEAVPRN
jgi:hypothetical protein